MNEAARDTKIESTALQIRKIGNSVGVILPKELSGKAQSQGGRQASIRSSNRMAACG